MIFQTMNHVRPNNLSLKFQRCTPLGCNDEGIRKFEFGTIPLYSDYISANYSCDLVAYKFSILRKIYFILS